ncbi:hypothetical protein CHUAL_000949 [Chamberlinius hualienensis]
MLLSTQVPSAVESWAHSPIKTYHLPSSYTSSLVSNSIMENSSTSTTVSNSTRADNSSSSSSSVVGRVPEVNDVLLLPPPPIDDSSIYSSSAVTRKRKISKMWETMYGTALSDVNLFGPASIYSLGRSNEHDNRQPQKELRKDSTTKMANWRVDEIDGNLAADFDDSLSGLGVELGTASYNMSEALLALPSLPVFKQEPESENGIGPSPPSPIVACVPVSRCQHVPASTSQSSTVNSGGSGSLPSHNNSIMLHNALPTTPYAVPNNCVGQYNSTEYQYILGAATSIATKMSEETLTYLNQGQSYEVKLKKLGDVTNCRGKLLKSVIRVCFHERRLQYMEKEQISSWKHTRPGERILDIDIPLSYGIRDVVQDAVQLNMAEFVWDPTKETGVYVRVNCISTEFTPKKHGGEKGVPFRIQIETFSANEGTPQRLNCASCQVKVFKPKGADRKHKTDREKMEKRSGSDQGKFQPSYNCTVLRETPLDSIYTAPNPPSTVSSTIPTQKSEPLYSVRNDQPGTPTSLTADSPVLDNDTLDGSAFELLQLYQQTLPTDATAAQTSQWLQANRFGIYLRTFASFSGSDILRLNRDDVIQICGLADGIRLYNALHSRAIRPRLTMYVCMESEQVYHAIYLDNLTVEELMAKLAQLLSFQLQNVQNVYIQGPGGIHVLITDEVVRNISEESLYHIELIKGNDHHYQLLLKSANA